MRYPLIDQLNATFPQLMFKLDPQSPQQSRQFVDPHFSRTPPLDRQDSLLFSETDVFGKVGVATYFILF